MPKSWSLKKKKAMNGKPHRQTADIDNLLKALIDAPREVLVDNNDPAQGYQANVAGLTPNPDAVAGYDY